MCLELGERWLDGIKVGTVGWQVAQFNAGGPENLFDGLHLVRGQIIQDQHVARMQARQQRLLEIHQENLGIDRPVHQKWSDDPFVTQGSQKRRTLPVTVWNRAQAAFAPGASTIEAGQLGIQACLVDEDQTADVP